MREEDVEAVLETLRSGWLTMGPRIAEFEAAFAAWAGAPHAVAVSSGTAALHLACLAAGVAPGVRVVVPAYGSRAAVDAVEHCGGEIVWGDVVSADDPVLDAAAAPAADVAIAEHIGAHAADVAALLDRGLIVIEDCRDALGLGVGTLGLAGCFSFADGRPLAIGEGGMVITGSEDVAARVRLLRAHAMTSGTWDRHRGHSDTYDVVDLGFNFRLDEPRAALGLSLLAHVDEDLAAWDRRPRPRRLHAELPNAAEALSRSRDALR